MTATQTSSTPAYQVDDQVQVQRTDTTTPGRIGSICRREDGVEDVVRADPTDAGVGGVGSVVNLWTMSGPSLLCLAPAGGASR
jgi:hypothetical protein